MIVEELPDETPQGIQAYFINNRHPKFSDIRVRQGIGQLYDFEATQRTLLYGQYQRIGELFPELRLRRVGAADGGRDRPSRALSRAASAGALRAGLRTAEDRWQRTQSRAVPGSGPAVQGGRLEPGRRQAHPCRKRRGDDHRNPDPQPRSGAACGSLRQESAACRHRDDDTHGRFVPISGAPGRFRLRHDHGPAELLPAAGAGASVLLRLRGRRYQRVGQHGGHQESGGGRADRADRRRKGPGDAEGRPPGRSIACCSGTTMSCRMFYNDIDRIAYWNKFGRPERKPRYDVGFLNTWWIDPEQQQASR